uniref:Uncharacterized protein n=1 Tax=viral metagenome TaxID=1070528 RepID=A0A6C0L4E2_9ZZZZ|tara:strand:+ start:3119 stop:4156 length:1038 start_codon:yes stop_codon:yes gene_type:complete
MGGIASKAGMQIVGVIMKGALCAPYGLPIGLLNHKGIIDLDMCYQSEKTRIELEKQINHGSTMSYEQGVGLEGPGFKSSNRVKVANSNITNVLNDNISFISQNQETVQDVIKNFGLAQAGLTKVGDDIVGNEYGPWDSYDIDKMNNEQWNYKGYVMKAYGCQPVIDQRATLKIIGNSSITEEVEEEITNEVMGTLESEIKDTDPGEGSGVSVQAQIDSLLENRSSIKVNIHNKITQFINQNSQIGQKITYEDNYGVCDPQRYIEDGQNLGATITQSAKLSSLASNIINSSVNIVIENKTNFKSDQTLKVNRITEYRIILVSFIWNVVYIYLVYHLIKMLYEKMTE